MEAEESGLLRNLPGAGKPLPREDDREVPGELRSAYRILKNAGFLPEELELRRECLRLRDLLAACGDGGSGDDSGQDGLREQLSANLLRYEMLVERRGRIPANGTYDGALRRRLGGR